MHLIATRDDLGTFAHVHPEPTGRPGELAVTLTFPTAGSYDLHTEFARQGVDEQHPRPAHHHRRTDPAPRRPRRWSPARGSSVVDGVRVTLSGQARADATSDLTFSFADATHRASRSTTCKPYLAAAGHIVVLRADGGDFAHEHAEGRDQRRQPGVRAARHPVRAASSTRTSGSTPPASTSCGPSSGSANGHVITVPFTVQAT